MLKTLGIIFCALFTLGCQSGKKYTTSEQYVEERRLDREKGVVENSQASWEISWENL